IAKLTATCKSGWRRAGPRKICYTPLSQIVWRSVTPWELFAVIIATNLQTIADQIVLRAQRQGSLQGRAVRGELLAAGLSESLWKDVLALARGSLSYRNDHYYYTASVSERVRAEQSQQQDVRSAVESLTRDQTAAGGVERREQDRFDFVQPV